MSDTTAVEPLADVLADHERRLDCVEDDLRIYRNLIALMAYTVPAPRRVIPHPRPAHTDPVPLFPHRPKVGGHL